MKFTRLFERLVKIGDAASQLVQVSICPRVEDTTANESLSGRAYREGWWIRHPINWVFFWQENHCRRAYYRDGDRAAEYLEKMASREDSE